MKKYSLLISAVILAFSACKPVTAVYESEKTKGVDFSKYKTYAWRATKDTAYTKLVSKQKVERALASEVIKELTLRGMQLDTLHPDCLFTYTLVMNKTYDIGQQPNNVYNPQVYAPVWAGQNNIYYYVQDNGPVGYSGGLNVTTFRDGSLVIDMIDRSSNQIVWRTTAQAKRNEAELEGAKHEAREMIPAMFKKFPKKKI